MTTPTIDRTKAPKWADVEISGNVPTTDVTRMTVDAAGAAHIMTLLTDLYSDPELAVLREYTSNAIDSHRAAGQTIPIEVHLPTAFAPNFIVQDYGTGMSLNDIKKIYSAYGASTKRDDLNQIGAFGLGCKSALTLTQQFTVVSVQDGKRTVAHILRGADGVGEVSIISHKETEEANGVKITIPVPDHTSFASKASQFFFTWKSDDVLVDGEKPATLFDHPHIEWTPMNGEVAKAYMLRPAKARGYYDNYEHGLYVMLGGIRYSVDLTNQIVAKHVETSLRALAGQTVIMIEAPIGSVDLVPSREALRYSPRTGTNLGLMFNGIIDDIYELVSKDVSEAETRTEAVKRKTFWRSLGGRFNGLTYNWNGVEVPNSVNLDDVWVNYFTSSSRAIAGYVFKLSEFTNKQCPRVFTLSDNVDPDVPRYYTIDARKPGEIRGYTTMFRDFLRQNNKSLSHAMLYHFTAKPTDPWFLEFATEIRIDKMLADAKKYRSENRKPVDRSAQVPAQDFTYPAIVIASSGDVSWDHAMKAGSIPVDSYYLDLTLEGPSIDNGLKKFIDAYGRGSLRYGDTTFDAIRAIFATIFPQGGTVVLVDRGRKVEALMKRSSNVKNDNFYTSYKQAAATVLKKHGSAAAAAAEVIDVHFYDRLNPREFVDGIKNVISLIDDPEMVEVVTSLIGASVLDKRYAQYLRNVVGHSASHTNPETLANELKNRVIVLLDKYPLLGVLSQSTHSRSAVLNDLVEYLNYTYAKENNA